MSSITETLIAEHGVFTDLFTHIEGLLPDLKTLAEVRLLATLVERLLQSHAEAEGNLAYLALDHVLEDKGHIDRLHQDHQEIDASLARAQTSPSLEEARRLLRTAIAASREHFRREERSVFPLLEQALEAETLAALGAARVQHRGALAG